jgi:hypothetical protein
MNAGSMKALACRDSIALLDAYVDGELSGEAASRMFRHVSGCRNCSELVDERKFIKNRVRASVSSTFTPAQLICNVHAALRKVDRSNKPELFPDIPSGRKP